VSRQCPVSEDVSENTTPRRGDANPDGGGRLHGRRPVAGGLRHAATRRTSAAAASELPSQKARRTTMPHRHLTLERTSSRWIPAGPTGSGSGRPAAPAVWPPSRRRWAPSSEPGHSEPGRPCRHWSGRSAGRQPGSGRSRPVAPWRRRRGPVGGGRSCCRRWARCRRPGVAALPSARPGGAAAGRPVCGLRTGRESELAASYLRDARAGAGRHDSGAYRASMDRFFHRANRLRNDVKPVPRSGGRCFPRRGVPAAKPEEASRAEEVLTDAQGRS